MKRKLDVDLEPGEASALEWMAGVISTRDLELLVVRHNVEASRVPELMSALVKVRRSWPPASAVAVPSMVESGIEPFMSRPYDQGSRAAPASGVSRSSSGRGSTQSFRHKENSF